VFTLGPYRFSDMDARRTVDNLEDLWPLFSQGIDGAQEVLAPLQPELTGDIDADLPLVWHAFLQAGSALRHAGLLPAAAVGTVDALHRNAGGVPKLPVPEVDVDFGGVVGDRQRVRVHHGRPWQALCLWSAEVIETFAAAGHPLQAGFAGENITVRGLDWSDVRPGVRLRVGTVVCDVVAYSLPCKTNARWFLGRDFNVMHHERGAVSRVYAVVIEPGHISVGDAAILEP
jgi:MOSC domain-containing protein YiiM